MSSQPGTSPAGDVLADRLMALLDAVALNDSRIRRQADGGVHGMRVAVRSLRSLLASFGVLYDEEMVPSLREDLRWIGGELSGARDAEVVRQRVQSLATSDVEHELVARVSEHLKQTEAVALADGVEVLDSERYSRTLRDLTAFTQASGNFGEGRPSDADLRQRVRIDWKRLRKRVRAVDAIEGEAERQEGLHEVRKAAKRLRYSAETLVPVHGDDAARLAKGAKRVQTVLGEFQDSVIAQVRLRWLAEQAHWSRRELFLLGGLHAREESTAAQSEAAYQLAWSRLAKKNRRWLT